MMEKKGILGIAAATAAIAGLICLCLVASRIADPERYFLRRSLV